MKIEDLTPQERAALDALIPETERSGVIRADLAAALRNSMEIRRQNSINGTAVIGALRRDGVTWRDITALTGVPWATARRWHEKPPGSPADEPADPPLGNAS